MYNLDYVIVLYHLTYGAKWDRDFSRNKMFGKFVADSDRKAVLDKFADVTKAWRTKTPPPVDLSGWRFNDYKTAIATKITDAEYDAIKAQARNAMSGGLPNWKKQAYYDAAMEIKELRDKSKGASA